MTINTTTNNATANSNTLNPHTQSHNYAQGSFGEQNATNLPSNQSSARQQLPQMPQVDSLSQFAKMNCCNTLVYVPIL